MEARWASIFYLNNLLGIEKIKLKCLCNINFYFLNESEVDFMSYDLFPHNQKVFDMAMTAFKNTNKVAIVQATGTGKGFLAGAFINGPFKRAKTLILAPNNDILLNYTKSLGVQESERVKKMTYSKLLSLYKLDNETFLKIANIVDFVIVDEFHRLGAEKWGESTKELIEITANRGKFVLGLTATPVRYNDLSVMSNNIFESLSDEEKYKLKKARNMVDELFGGNIVQGITLEEAVFAGVLPSFKYILGSFGYDSAIAEARERITEMYETNNYLRYSKKMSKVENLLKQLETKYGSEDENLRKLVEPEVKRLVSNQKWIVFCDSKEQLEDIDVRMGYWFGMNINQYYRTKKVSQDCLNIYQVHSGLNNIENMENLSKFYDVQEGMHIIKCIGKLTEGAHVPNVTGIIMLRNTLSPIVYLQQIGRALSAGNKNMPIIFDFVGNIENISKVAKGADEYVNSIKKSANILNDLNAGKISPVFLTSQELGFYRKDKGREPKIVIKDTVVNISRLFDDIEDILHISSSIQWSEEQINILKKYYPYGGAKVVQKQLELRTFSRTEEAINAKARDLGLPTFDKKRNIMKLNEDNTLEWTPEEDDLIIEAFNGASPEKFSFIATDLHAHHMANRKPEAIIYRLHHIREGRRSVENKNRVYPNNGKRWTKDELYTLKYDALHGIPKDRTAYELGRSPEAILSKGQEIGVYRQKRNLTDLKSWSKEDEDFLYENYHNIDKRILADTLGVTVSSLDKKYRRIRLSRQGEYRMQQINQKSVIKEWSYYEDSTLSNCIQRNLSWEETCGVMQKTGRTPKEIIQRLKYFHNNFGDKYPELWKSDAEFRKLL